MGFKNVLPCTSVVSAIATSKVLEHFLVVVPRRRVSKKFLFIGYLLEAQWILVFVCIFYSLTTCSLVGV